MSTCRSCSAPIVWLRAEPSGKAIPIDDSEQARAYAQEGRWFKASDNGPDLMPHHATCPQGREWQRKRARARNAAQVWR